RDRIEPVIPSQVSFHPAHWATPLRTSRSDKTGDTDRKFSSHRGMQQRRQHSSMSAIEIFYSGAPIKQRAYDLAAGLPTHSPCEMAANRSLTMILPNQNMVPWFARWTTPALMIAPRASVIIALGIFAMTAGCGSIRSSGGD